jgi:hypothetical protein
MKLGVVANYFKPRWQLFMSSLISSLQEGQKDFDQKVFNAQVLNSVEIPFTKDKTAFSTTPQGKQGIKLFYLIKKFKFRRNVDCSGRNVRKMEANVQEQYSEIF